MGQIHNELRRADVSRAVKDALGVTDEDSGVERFGETITPVIDLWRQPEWYNLRDELLWAFTITQAAVAGEFSAGGIINPAGSKKLLVIELADGRATGATSVSAGWATSAVMLATLASAQAVLTRDLRANPQVAAALVAFGSDVAVGNIITQVIENELFPAGAINTPLRALPVVLPPGFGYAVVGNTVNTGITVNLVGRERAVFPAELG